MSSISVDSSASNDVTGRVGRCNTGSPTTLIFGISRGTRKA
jgi:hypothetical protein